MIPVGKYWIVDEDRMSDYWSRLFSHGKFSRVLALLPEAAATLSNVAALSESKAF